MFCASLIFIQNTKEGGLPHFEVDWFNLDKCHSPPALKGSVGRWKKVEKKEPTKNQPERRETEAYLHRFCFKNEVQQRYVAWYKASRNV
jgi:hypothetical protein